MKKYIMLLLIVLSSATLSACAPENTNTSYSNYAIGAQGNVVLGKIVQMTPIQTTGSNSVGTLAGAGAGAAAGSMLGGNTAVHIIGGIGGALLGGALGSATESALTSTNAYEFIIQKQNGAYISVVQSNELALRVGDSVWVSTVQGTTRIRSRATVAYQ